MVTEEELPYWHLEHEVLLAEAKANVSNSAVEEAGGSEHQDQVEVPRKGSLEEGKEVHCHIDDMEEDSVENKNFVIKPVAVHAANIFSFSTVQHRPDSCMHTGTGSNEEKALTSSHPLHLTGETSDLNHSVRQALTVSLMDSRFNHYTVYTRHMLHFIFRSFEVVT